MKCKLVGFNQFNVVKNKDTGEVSECLMLHFVRKPNLREPNAQGIMTISCILYDESIKKLADSVELKIEADYDCDINQFKGKNYLNDISEVSG